MIKKTVGVLTSVVAALAVVGVAWAASDDGSSTSATAETASSADSSVQGPVLSTAPTVTESSSGSIGTSTPSTSTSIGATTSTSSGATTSTSSGATSTSEGSSTTSTSIGSSTSTSSDASDRRTVPDGVSTHALPGFGSVTVEVRSGRLSLVSVTAPGWKIERQRVEADRIELELASGESRARFEAKVNDGRMEVDVKVDSD